MSLATGTRIGPYEITGTLGAGGMGEVYRAHDSRLARDVALKVLQQAAPTQRIIVVRNWFEELKRLVPIP